jgi:hypothetical protein
VAPNQGKHLEVSFGSTTIAEQHGRAGASPTAELWGLPPAAACAGLATLEGQRRPWHAAKSTCLQLPLRLRAHIVHK